MKNWMRANKGLLMFVMLFGIFRTAIADWNPIPSGSMRPNLLEGDVVFVNRLAFDLKLPLTDIILTHLGEPQRGDVATFSSPQDQTRLIKRIVALPGDTVEMRQDRLFINGQGAEYTNLGSVVEPVDAAHQLLSLQLNETAAGGTRRIQLLPQLVARRDFAAMVVPPDRFLMLGDNRNNSVDSRYIGLVPRELLIGRAERILVSADIKGNWLPRAERFGMPLGDSH